MGFCHAANVAEQVSRVNEPSEVRYTANTQPDGHIFEWDWTDFGPTGDEFLRFCFDRYEKLEIFSVKIARKQLVPRRIHI